MQTACSDLKKSHHQDFSKRKNRMSNHQAYKSEISYITKHQLFSADHANSACQHE